MEKSVRKIAVSSYSMDPGPRYVRQGADSGEDYYHKILNQAFYQAVKNNSILEVNLDGTDGYASSFLDESFGNLVFDFSLDLVKENLRIIFDEEPELKKMIEDETFIEWGKRRKNKDKPKITAPHEDWYRYDGKDYIKKKWIEL